MTPCGLITSHICHSLPTGLFSLQKVCYVSHDPNLVDKLGDWFESYVKAMELNVWTSTTIQGTPTFDETTHIWTITLKRGDWIRTLHPKHIILASGSSGEPNIPNFPGAESFKGD